MVCTWCGNCGKNFGNDNSGCVIIVQHSEDSNESVVFMAGMPAQVVYRTLANNSHVHKTHRSEAGSLHDLQGVRMKLWKRLGSASLRMVVM